MISVYKDFDNPPKDLLGDNPQITDAVKRELWELYHGKCAFSEEKISFEEMEVAHYRPVKAYPELEFEWSNLLPVSGRTNKVLSNHFPIQGKKVNSELLKNPENRKADSDCLLAEKPVLLHPEVDTPENHFYFLDERISAFTLKGKTTIERLQLNHEILVEDRVRIAKKLENIITELKNTIKESLKERDNEIQGLDLGNRYAFAKKIAPDYISSILPFYQKAKVLSNITKANSRFAQCYIERKMLGMEHAYLPEISSYPQLPSLSEYSTDIISLGLNFLVNAPFYITKQDGTVQELKSSVDVAWNEAMSYAICSINIKKYHSIKALKIEDIPLNAQWIFLTGENGHGKTLVLQAITLTFSGDGSFEEDKIRYTDDRTNIITKLKKVGSIANLSFPRNINWNNPFESVRDFGDGNNVVSARPEFMNYAAYGANRLELSGYVGNASQSPQKISKTDSLFTNNGVLHNIEEYLINIHGREQFQTRYNSIKAILLEILPNIADIIIEDTYEKKKVLYQERAEDNSLLPLIPFHALSTGSKNLIALVGDMIIELSLSNGLTDSTFNPSDLKGIVIIDEIDAHLHPKWQKELVQTLTRLFPKIQFIVSTHSPIPLLGAPKETVILNVEKPSKKEGITVRRLDIDVTTLTPNTILTSPIFGFEGIISSAHNYNEPLYTQDTYNDVIFEQHLKKKLKKLAEESTVNLDDLLNG